MADVLLFHHAQGLRAMARRTPLQIHMMDADSLVVDDGDLAVARELAATVNGAELLLYPGHGHLFMDETLPDYDPVATNRMTDRIISLLDASR